MSQGMIAIVDDYKAVREGLEKLLRSLGYRTSAFSSAEDFLKSEKLRDTSCLITGVQMPGLNGTDLQERPNGLPAAHRPASKTPSGRCRNCRNGSPTRSPI